MGGCGNCGTSFTQEVYKASKIKSTWDHKSKNKEAKFVPISEALSIIFEKSPLKHSSTTDLDFENSIFSKSIKGNGQSGKRYCSPLDLCPKCAETLTILYNSFQEFTQICKLECEIAKRLKELDTLRDRDGIQDNNNISSAANNKRKRGRPPKKAPPMEKSDSEESLDQIQNVEFKKKYNSNMKIKEEKLENEFYLKEKDSEEECYYSDRNDLNDDDVRSRRPRPVRKALTLSKDRDVIQDNNNISSAANNKRKRGRPPKKAPAPPMEQSDSEESLDQIQNVEFKRKYNSNMKIKEEKLENEFYLKEKDSEEECYYSDRNDLNDDDDDRTRSPRPVRKASTRSKDLNSSIFKDNEDEFLDDEMTTGSEGECDEFRKDLEKTDDSEEEENDEYNENSDDDKDDEDFKPTPANKKSKSKKIIHLKGKNPTGGLECLECGKKFSYKKSLERHCRTHTEDNGSVECDTCGKVFSRDDHLKRHRKQVHGEELPLKPAKREYDCPLCGVCFLRKALDEHVNSVHKDVESPWKCSQPNCEKAFSTFSELSKHKSVHYERRKEKCEVCNLSFRSGYHLKRHQTGIHHVRSDKIAQEYSSSEDEDVEGEKKISTFRCPECKKKFTTPERLKEHLIIHGIGERHKCEICLREFNHMRSKQRHMLLHSEDNPYKCYVENCTNNFCTRKEQLVRHLSNVHAIQPSEQDLPLLTRTPGENKKSKCPVEKEVQCPHCDKVVKRERLRLHMVIHTGEKRHMCDLCGQKFGLRTTLLTHIQCVHQGVRRYTCTYCGKAFKRSNHLKDHEKLHTDADSKPFVCNICKKAFRRKKNLKSHMICHIGSKDFMCEVCGKAFSRIDNMRAHVKTVHQGLSIRKEKPRKVSTAVKNALKKSRASSKKPKYALKKLKSVFKSKKSNSKRTILDEKDPAAEPKTASALLAASKTSNSEAISKESASISKKLRIRKQNL